jgi:hypothetical protein
MRVSAALPAFLEDVRDAVDADNEASVGVAGMSAHG